MFDSRQSTIHGVAPLTGVTVVGSLYTEQSTSIRFMSVDEPWGHNTDWRYGRGVPGHVPKHKCSTQVRTMGSHHRLALRSWGPCTEQNTNARFRSFDDPRMGSALTGVTDVESRYTYQNTCSIQVSRGSIGGTPLTGVKVLGCPGWALQRVGRLSGVGHSKESLQGASRQPAELGTPRVSR